MRYYKIVITDPKTGQVQVPNSMKQILSANDASYTSYVNGQTLRGALNIELDVLTYLFAVPEGGSFVRVWGISLEEISQAKDLNFFNIAVYGGMQKGLPLATGLADKSGLLFAGQIIQSFGNWIGLDQTLDLIVVPGPGVPADIGGTGTIADPKNLVHLWKKGTKLADAIQQTLRTAFPGYTADIQISDDLVYTEDDTGFYQTIEQYAQYLKGVSFAILNPNPKIPFNPVTGYRGVDIFLHDKVFKVFDGTNPTQPLQIRFQDMIGQPTWIAQGTMQVKFPMRADIKVGDYIQMPNALVTTTSAAQSQAFDLQSAFKGVFLVNSVRHTGNFRQSDAASWVTIVTCVATSLPESKIQFN